LVRGFSFPFSLFFSPQTAKAEESKKKFPLPSSPHSLKKKGKTENYEQ